MKKPDPKYSPLSARQLAAIRKRAPKRRGRMVSSLLVPVAIDSGYPSETAMDALRKLPVPRLTKTTKSLF